ncbi:MAG: lysophospholipid acyltransferase family protein [Pelolinea sp.]|nr:lysophospholipid acyltransferase family protein [Pelolinea sp.]
MSLQSFINSRFGIGLILALGKMLPPFLGYSLCEKVSVLLSAQKNSDIVKAVRANQWIISGRSLSADELDEQTQETFRQTSRWLYDFYHNVDNYKNISNRVTLSKKLVGFLSDRLGGNEGTILVGPHLSNFDFGGRAIVFQGYDVQVLSYPQPLGGYQWQNKLRKDAGMNVTPMSTESMRAAMQRLKKGGGVVTGMDRPLDHTNYHPRFFGFPAPVPTSYVRMALQTKSAVIVLVCIGLPEENYHVECSDLIYMEPDDDPVKEIEKNAEKVLREAEKFIKEYPSQWAMFYPVWPFALEEMP